MDGESFTTLSPLATVQLIPVINYLNLLSDFLFLENYLAEVNQNKQIPIVNALYEYFDENQDVSRKANLIRYLLQGSDLYGEKNSEELDIIFVNTMFDYIISSLVFDKYGNIYGFLAEVVRRTENLQHNHVLMVVKETLRNATFENEYGANSVLTNLAVDRIFNDIILLFFPQPDTNLSLLSLDYIFAQAGSMYLRLGKINDTYFPGSKNSHIVENDTKTSFNDYLTTGHVIEKLIHGGKMDPLNLRVFALSALFYYVTAENQIKNEIITNIIFSPHHWKTAYDDLFEYLDTVFDRIENQLMQVYINKIHSAFSHFQSLATMTDFIINLECRFLNRNYHEKSVWPYIQHFKQFECKSGFVVANIKDWYQEQIDNFGEIYGKYDLGISRQSLSKFAIEDLSSVRITLLLTIDRLVNNDSNSSQNSSYELLEFYCTKNKTYDFYALIQENNKVSLIKESDDSQLFQKKINISVIELIQLGHRTILKNDDEGSDEFTEEVPKVEKGSKIHLHFRDDRLRKNEWWKEFGLSLKQSYPCLLKIENLHIKNKLCEKSHITFFDQFQDDLALQLTHEYTESLLSSLGTTINTIFIKDAVTAIIKARENVSLLPHMVNMDENFNTIKTIYDTFSLHIEDPAFLSTSTTQNEIILVTKIVDDLENNFNYSFTSVKNVLNQMQKIKTPYMKSLSSTGEKKIFFVNAGINNSGYGYKFIIAATLDGRIEFAQLRTGYEFKDAIFIRPIQSSLKDEKKYLIFNTTNFKIEPYYIYEINNQLRKKSTRSRFSGISIYYQNSDKCESYDYLHDKKQLDNCLRNIRFFTQTTLYEEETEKLLRKIGILDRKDFVSEMYARKVLQTYTFPNQAMFLYFIQNWIRDNSFDKSDWSSENIIDKSGLLRKLLYDVHLGKCNLSLSDGKSRIDSIYTYRERRKIEDGTSLENIIHDYNEQRACYSVTFEDYYAIRNFATTGNRRISGDTTEAKLMKIALYKLAVRQFEDLGEGFELILFRFCSRPRDFVYRELYQGKRIVLQKFTLTKTSEESAMRYGGYPTAKFENVLYEFKFNGPHFRAKIESKVERFESVLEKEIILLPGSEFTVTEILTETNIGGIGNFTKVVLTSTFDNDEKFEWYKKIINKITQSRL